MTNPTDDAARAAFESWYSDGDLDCPSIRRNPDGGYYLMGAHCGWQAWRAAWLYTAETQSKLEPLLRELVAAREKASQGEWEPDTVKNCGEYGSGPDTYSGFTSYRIFCGDDILVDTLNSTASLIEEEFYDEGHEAWDKIGRNNSDFIAKAANIATQIKDILNDYKRS